MVKEVRRILFSYDEVRQALDLLKNKIEITTPHGNITKIIFGSATETSQIKPLMDVVHEYNLEPKARSVVITFYNQESQEHKYITLPADYMSAALVEFCFENKISLPRTSAKSFDLSGLNAILDLSSGEDEQKESGSAPSGFTLED